MHDAQVHNQARPAVWVTSLCPLNLDTVRKGTDIERGCLGHSRTTQDP